MGKVKNKNGAGNTSPTSDKTIIKKGVTQKPLENRPHKCLILLSTFFIIEVTRKQ